MYYRPMKIFLYMMRCQYWRVPEGRNVAGLECELSLPSPPVKF